PSAALGLIRHARELALERRSGVLDRVVVRVAGNRHRRPDDGVDFGERHRHHEAVPAGERVSPSRHARHGEESRTGGLGEPERPGHRWDRKSTRLNSSHRTISYAGFCLKKKKKTKRKAIAQSKYTETTTMDVSTTPQVRQHT